MSRPTSWLQRLFSHWSERSALLIQLEPDRADGYELVHSPVCMLFTIIIRNWNSINTTFIHKNHRDMLYKSICCEVFGRSESSEVEFRLPSFATRTEFMGPSAAPVESHWWPRSPTGWRSPSTSHRSAGISWYSERCHLLVQGCCLWHKYSPVRQN